MAQTTLRRSPRVARFAFLFALLVPFPTSLQAQLTESERQTRRAIGEIISVGVVLSATDLVGGGRFDLSGESEGSFRLRHLGGRMRFRQERRLVPWVRGALGRVKLEQPLDFFGEPLDEGRLDGKSLLVAGGFRYSIDEHWYVEPEAGVVYSRVENELIYRNPLTEAFAPIIDGRLFNWEAEALTAFASVRVGYEYDWSNGFAIDVAAQAETLSTNPFDTDDPIQEASTNANVARLQARARLPLSIDIREWGLYLSPRINYIAFNDVVSRPLGSDSMTALGLRLVAEPKQLSSDRSWWFPKAFGVGITRTEAASFDGWSVGVTLQSWNAGW